MYVLSKSPFDQIDYREPLRHRRPVRAKEAFILGSLLFTRHWGSRIFDNLEWLRSAQNLQQSYAHVDRINSDTLMYANGLEGQICISSAMKSIIRQQVRQTAHSALVMKDALELIPIWELDRMIFLGDFRMGSLNISLKQLTSCSDEMQPRD